MNYNKLILAGHLARDPEVNYLPSNCAVCNFTVAVNHRWKSQDGTQREDVSFIGCQMFGKRAEAFAKYHGKGDAVFVEGRIKQDTWRDAEGKNKSKTKAHIESFEFVGGKATPTGSKPTQPQNTQPQQPQSPPEQPEHSPQPPTPDDSFNPDDIPF